MIPSFRMIRGGEALMRAGLFWLNDRQWACMAPQLPTNLTGPEREDDRRIISGIVHMLQCGARWRDCLANCGKDSVTLSIDSTSIKAHRSASGGKGGSMNRRSVARAADAPQKSTR